MRTKICKFFLSAAVLLFSVGCGQADGYANSKTTNTYNFLYVGNLGSSTINSYYLDSKGAPIIAAPVITTGPGTTSVSGLAGSPDGLFLYAANKNTNNISWYSVDPMSSTTPGKVTYSNLEVGNSGTTSIKVHPTGNVAYSTESTATTNNVSIFTVNKVTGVLTPALTMATARTNPWDLAFSPSGQHLFVINRGTSDITSFAVNTVSGALSLVNNSMATGTNPEDLAFHPSGSFFYTLCVGVNSVYMYRVAGGGLTALSTPSVATGSGPKRMVVTPNGKFLIVSNNTSNSLSVYSIDATTGIATPVAGSPFAAAAGAGVYALAVTPDSKYLAVSGDTSGKGYIYQIDATTGTLSQVGSEFTLGSNPRAMEIISLKIVE